MPLIAHDPRLRLWVLSGPTTTQVLHLDEQDLLRSLHWGRKLTLDQAASLIEPPGPYHPSFENPAEGHLELAAAGAHLRGQTGVQVLFADGTRDLELLYRDSHIDDGVLKLIFADRYYPLTATACYRVRPDTDVIERWLELRNDGDPVTVARSDSATWVIPPLGDYRLSQVRGSWAAETRLHRTGLAYGETLLTGQGGITGHDTNPWMMIDDGTATEEHGSVYSCALAWSGNWRMTAQRLPSERVTVSTGLGHHPATWKLRTGETFTTPVSAGLHNTGGFGGTSRAWHDYQLAHIIPHAQELRPVLYNSWEATGFAVSDRGQIELADHAHALGTELFVMDDGWFGARTHDGAGLGDWTPNPDRFPDGLTPLIEHVHDLGMQFGLWVEPEMVNPDSDLYRAHPHWVLHQPHRSRTERRNQLVLNLARPDVRDWVHGRLDELLTKNSIDFLKWDMNRPFTEAGWPGTDDPERLWIDHTRHVHAIIDQLRVDHPALRIENCSSGGGRLDLAMLSRTDQVWTSDNTDAVDRLTIQNGFSQLYPARVMAAWVTDSPNPHTGRSIPLAFRFHSAMQGVLALGGSLNAWTPEDLAQAAELVSDYKTIRPLVQHGHQYRLTAPPVTAIQYLARDQSATAVLAYRIANSFAERSKPIRLQGLDPHGKYREARTGRIHHGAVLLSHGLRLDLPSDDHASSLTHMIRLT
ncbi:alpha-galactosidase [Actinocorallia longicatena]|uniref:Alpha-galactosidase n=1 Tax=Actinocorallia longicatena TaxID=111803 RepID=A0ABP6Q6E3_9ACTN